MEETPRDGFKKISHLLDLAESIHKKVQHHYEKQKRSLRDIDAKMLLDYIARKEHHVGSMISRYRKEAPAEVLETFYQFTPAETKTLADYTAWQPNPHADAAEVLSVALKIDSFMQSFYRRAAQMAPSEESAELFGNLADAINDKKRDQASNASLLEDL
jgi:hypothetical protein